MIGEATAVLSILLTFFGGVLVIAFNRNKAISGFILASILMLFSWHNFISHELGAAWVLRFPYLLIIAKPLYLALPPLSYLYFKYGIFKKYNISKQDYLHFIPSFIILLDLVFYYALEAKTWDVANVDHKIAYGFISKPLFTAFNTLQGLIYILFVWFIDVKPLWKRAKDRLDEAKKNWLLLFKITVTLLYILIAYNTYRSIVIIGVFSPVDPIEISRIVLLTMTVVLFFFPSVLYRTAIKLPHGIVLEENLAVEKVTESQTQVLADERLANYISQIEALNSDSRFFKSIVTITDLADFLQMSPRHLTYILNHHYQMRFTDFINGHRVRYIIKQFGTGFLKELTMEAIAFEAGFSSRSTFFSAFKRYTGKNPSQFLKDQVLEQN